jgi:hypothetical protein
MKVGSTPDDAKTAATDNYAFKDYVRIGCLVEKTNPKHVRADHQLTLSTSDQFCSFYEFFLHLVWWMIYHTLL